MNRILHHARSNIVGYVALFVALGGTGYAAVSIPNNSIDPVKLNPRIIGGYVRQWASVDADGKVVAGSGKPHVVARVGVAGGYLVNWRRQRLVGCVPDVGLQGTPYGVPASPSNPGFALAGGNRTQAARGQVSVATFDAQGLPVAHSFFILMICSTP